jgi:hypothetical protein
VLATATCTVASETFGVDAVTAFLLLGVIWAAVLVPPWLQSRREARPTASMVNFRRQLWSLARTSPGQGPVYADTYVMDDGYDAYDEDLDDVAAGDELAPRRSQAGSVVSVGSVGSVEAAPSSVLPSSRPGAGSYRRRRRVLSALTVMAVATVAPGVLLGGAWWIGQAVTGGLLVSYLALLIRRQRRLAERAQKVHYLAPIRAPRPAVVVLGSGAAR